MPLTTFIQALVQKHPRRMSYLLSGARKTHKD
jgi:hypothetical protein